MPSSSHLHFICAACAAAVVAASPPARQPAKDSKPVRVDLYGDPLPPGALGRLGSNRLRPGEYVRQLAFSHDGRIVAGGSWGSVRLWDAATSREIRRLVADREVSALAFSPDDRVLAVASNSVGFTSVSVWEHKTGKEARRLTLRGLVLSLAYSPDGTTLAAAVQQGASQASIRLWDVGSVQAGRELCRFQNYSCNWNVAFAPDGKSVASAGSNSTVCIRDVATGKIVRALKGHENEVTVVAFSADGKVLASGSQDATVRLWHVASGKEMRRFESSGGYVVKVAFAAGGRLLAAQDSHYDVRVWETATGTELDKCRRTGDGGMALAPDGSLLALAGADKTVHFWEIPTGKSRFRFQRHGDDVTSLAFGADGKTLASAGHDHLLILWEPASMKALQAFVEKEGVVALSRDGQVVLGGRDGVVRSWKAIPGTRTWEQVAQRREYSGPIGMLTLSRDGQPLALSHERLVLHTGDSFPFKADGTHAGAVSADGKVLACAGTTASTKVSAVHVIKMWSLDSGAELRQIGLDPSSAVLALTFAGGGRTLMAVATTEATASRTTGVLHCWDAASGGGIRQRPFVWVPVRDAVFSPDARMLALAGDDGGVRLWEVASGKERRCFRGHTRQVTAVAFSSSGTTLASGSADMTILLWDVYGRQGTPPQIAMPQPAALWEALAKPDAEPAFASICTLLRLPGTVAFLAEHLRPATAWPAARLNKLVADLDSDSFLARNKAMAELQEGVASGSLAAEGLQEALRRKLTATPSLELSRRGARLLRALQNVDLSPERLRLARAVEVVEQIGSPEAHRLLEVLADGASAAWLTFEARAALERLDQH